MLEEKFNTLEFALLHQSLISDYSLSDFDKELYFRLIHDHKNIQESIIPQGFSIKLADLKNKKAQIANFINQCYTDISINPKEVESWVDHPVHSKELCIWIYDEDKNVPAALGIAEFDNDVKEGSLEWIQVIPKYKGMGLGKLLCTELLSRLRDIAVFSTVSGQLENKSHPDILYRKVGFTGDDIWWVLRRKKIASDQPKTRIS